MRWWPVAASTVEWAPMQGGGAEASHCQQKLPLDGGKGGFNAPPVAANPHLWRGRAPQTWCQGKPNHADGIATWSGTPTRAGASADRRGLGCAWGQVLESA